MGDEGETQQLQAHDGLFLTHQEIQLQQLYEEIAKLNQSTRANDGVFSTVEPSTSHAPAALVRSSSSSSAVSVNPNLSAIDRVKAVMAAKAKQQTNQMAKGTIKQIAPNKRANPLADLLKPGASPVTSTTIKRPRVHAPNDSVIQQQTSINTTTGEMRLGNGRGIQLPPESFLRTDEWASDKDEPLSVTLPAVVFRTNNTLVVNGTIPTQSCRFVFNIATTDGTIVCHLNPRKMRGGQILLNSFVDNRWGSAQIVHRCPLVFGSSPFRFMLRVTITPSGFSLFVDEVFVEEFKHRIPLREGENLILKVPVKDEYGNPEVVHIHNVWWGHTDMSAAAPPPQSQQQAPPRPFAQRHDGRNQFDVYVGNLPSDATRSDLARLFGDFSYDYIRITPRGFGFVALKNQEDVDRAVRELDGATLPGFTVSLKISAALSKRTQ
ncbi:unnamed protein product [Aphanomyces euteiches]|uniref:Galectin n=1 Tax=Aphanomyces euteiches TaxID=100861 RepID=A0A6G0XJM9_9STRA|nr:hypothetical protein Ae201684_003955 [Aphanomyces euteiches]KAH9084622.1 hypothetical protein Ae201684P_001864 [Aphanomyces euteiches]KAH9157310.1 hypothetical protein AeRB84_000840 [Aphanomyces euteiches]